MVYKLFRLGRVISVITLEREVSRLKEATEIHTKTTHTEDEVAAALNAVTRAVTRIAGFIEEDSDITQTAIDITESIKKASGEDLPSDETSCRLRMLVITQGIIQESNSYIRTISEIYPSLTKLAGETSTVLDYVNQVLSDAIEFECITSKISEVLSTPVTKDEAIEASTTITNLTSRAKDKKYTPEQIWEEFDAVRSRIASNQNFNTSRECSKSRY